MSGPRRVGGRFVTTDEHTTYTRALVAPAAVWKKQWVVPSGLPLESKYKVLKWVKVDTKQDFSEESDSSPENGLSNIENDKPTLELPPAPTLRSHVSFAVESKPELGTETEDIEMSNADSTSITATTLTSTTASDPAKDSSGAQTPNFTPNTAFAQAPVALSSELRDATKPSAPNDSKNQQHDVAQIVESEMSGMVVEGAEEGGDGKGEGAQAVAQDESLRNSGLAPAPLADETTTAHTTATTTGVPVSAPAPDSSLLPPTATSTATPTVTETAPDSTAAPSESGGPPADTALPSALPSSLPIEPTLSNMLPPPPISALDSTPPDPPATSQPAEAPSSSSMPIPQADSAEPSNSAPRPDTATVLPGTGAMDITAPVTGEDPVGEGARIGGGLNALADQPRTS